MGTSLPIKSIKEINSIKALYKRKHKINECLLFVLAINTWDSLTDLIEYIFMVWNYTKLAAGNVKEFAI